MRRLGGFVPMHTDKSKDSALEFLKAVVVHYRCLLLMPEARRRHHAQKRNKDHA